MAITEKSAPLVYFQLHWYPLFGLLPGSKKYSWLIHWNAMSHLVVNFWIKLIFFLLTTEDKVKEANESTKFKKHVEKTPFRLPRSIVDDRKMMISLKNSLYITKHFRTRFSYQKSKQKRQILPISFTSTFNQQN